jgi:hypothetical protein
MPMLCWVKLDSIHLIAYLNVVMGLFASLGLFTTLDLASVLIVSSLEELG